MSRIGGKAIFLAFSIIFSLILCAGFIAGAEDTGVGELTEEPETALTFADYPENLGAYYAAESYTVRYTYKTVQSSGGDRPHNYVTGDAPASETVPAGGSHTVASNTFSFRDYIFNGWQYSYTDESGEKVTEYYRPGEIIYNIQRDMTLYASWGRAPVELKVYGIVGYSGGEDAYGDNPASKSVAVGEVFNLELNPYSKEGYSFIGWENGNRIFPAGASFLMRDTQTEFKAYWGDDGAILYSVDYDLNGGNGAAQVSFSVRAGTLFATENCDAEKTGYNFVGWTDADGNIYRSGDTCTASKNMILSAVWQEESKPLDTYFSVEISADEGGAVSPSGKISVKKGEAFSFTVSPDDTHKILSVKFDGEELGAGGIYTKTINSDVSVIVRFKAINVISSGEPSGEESYESSANEEESSSRSGVEISGDSSGNLRESEGLDAVTVILVISVSAIIVLALIWFAARSNSGKKRRRR